MNFRKLRKAVLLLQNKVWARALFKGVGAAIEHQQLLRSLSLDVVVDVGANKGQFSLLIRGVIPGAIIYAFEPLSNPAKIFSKIFDGDTNTHLYTCAVGECNESIAMHVSKSDDSSSLLPISEKQSNLFPGTEEDYIDNVTMSTLKSVISTDKLTGRSLLKIDVQGFELSVLKGSQPLLKEFGFIYIECSFVELYEGQALVSDIVDYLANEGFLLNGVYNMSYDKSGLAVQGDFLFVNSGWDFKE